MSKHDWNEQEIEEMLQQVPNIKDFRSRDDLMKELRKKGAFQENTSQNHLPNKKKWRMPKPLKNGALIAALTTLVCLPLLYALLNNEGDQSSAGKDVEIESTDRLSSQKEVEDNLSNGIQQSTSARQVDLRQNVYEDEVSDEIVFHLGVINEDAEAMPISMKLPKSWLNTVGLAEDATYLQLYEEVIKHFDEESYGFSPFHPMVGILEEKGTTLIHYLPDDYPYDAGTAALGGYLNAMRYTFGNAYETLVLLNENGEPAQSGHAGTFDPIVLNGFFDRQSIYKYEQRDGSTYFNLNYSGAYETVEDALINIDDVPNDLYESAMLEGIHVVIDTASSAEVIIQFTEPLDVTKYEETKLMFMLEALILTAESFGKQVRFTNIEQQQWAGFDFTEVIPHVIGINEISMNFQ